MNVDGLVLRSAQGVELLDGFDVVTRYDPARMVRRVVLVSEGEVVVDIGKISDVDLVKSNEILVDWEGVREAAQRWVEAQRR